MLFLAVYNNLTYHIDVNFGVASGFIIQLSQKISLQKHYKITELSANGINEFKATFINGMSKL